jgi:hypothetical protein
MDCPDRLAHGTVSHAQILFVPIGSILPPPVSNYHTERRMPELRELRKVKTLAVISVGGATEDDNKKAYSFHG